MDNVAEIIIAMATLVTALGSVLMSWRNGRKIEVIHLATNSMKDALVKKTEEAALAKGAANERERQEEKS